MGAETALKPACGDCATRKKPTCRAVDAADSCSGWTGGNARPPSLLPFQIHRLHGQVPVGIEDFEAALFFLCVGLLVGE